MVSVCVLNTQCDVFCPDLFTYPIVSVATGAGGPNSNDYAANHTLHHTIGLHDFGQQMRAFREVTCAQVLVQHITEAHHQIDWAISQALVRPAQARGSSTAASDQCQLAAACSFWRPKSCTYLPLYQQSCEQSKVVLTIICCVSCMLSTSQQYRKPAYIEICCNLAGLSHPSFSVTPVAYSIPSRHTNKASLDAAVRAAAEVLNKAVKPVLLAGPRLRHDNRRGAFQTLAEACQYGAAVTPDGKGLFQEDHDNFIGNR